MFRKRRRPTPNFQVPPPYNPMRGDHDDLQLHGDWPYCAMMQIACEDKYEHHVVCRGFDPRMLKFVDYRDNSAEKPGISVAKPFGCRVTEGGAKRYRIGEVFMAVLPTQGTTDIDVHYIPPSPVEVKWRLGQNPGFVDGSPYGGHPKCLEDEIEVLYDHNGKVINWMLVHTETKMFRFQSTEDLIDSDSCEACVRQMSGYWPHTATIYDPNRVFDGMLSGTKGYVLFQEGKYYIVNAKCDPDDPEECECTPVGEDDCECSGE
jgi:hypothetical protein